MDVEIERGIAEELTALRVAASSSLSSDEPKYLVHATWYIKLNSKLRQANVDDAALEALGPISNQSLVDDRSHVDVQNNWRWQPILKPRLSEHLDYVLVSEKEWQFLRKRWGGGPEVKRKLLKSDVRKRKVEVYPLSIIVQLVKENQPAETSAETLVEVSAFERTRFVLELIVNDVLGLVPPGTSPDQLDIAFAIAQYGEDLHKLDTADERVLNCSINELFENSNANAKRLVVSAAVDRPRSPAPPPESDLPASSRKRWMGKHRTSTSSENPLFAPEDAEPAKAHPDESLNPAEPGACRWVAGRNASARVPSSWGHAPAGKRTREAGASDASSFIRGLKLHNDRQALTAELKSKGGLAPGKATNTGTGAPGGLPRGACGLGNLGNTCYMNAALQCLSHVTELTDHLLRDLELVKREVHPDAPLGYRGEVPVEYRDVLRLLWSGDHGAVQPRRFKARLGEWNAMFKGYRQHDSHEFLSFMLTGLHEDLNRVRAKPYVEYDLDGAQGTREAAAKMMQLHRKRESSVVTDLFEGLLRSQLVCPHGDCGHKSINFDPFTVLSLALPVSTLASALPARPVGPSLPGPAVGPHLPPGAAKASAAEQTSAKTPADQQTSAEPTVGKASTTPLGASNGETSSILSTAKMQSGVYLSSDALFIPHKVSTSSPVRPVQVQVRLPMANSFQLVKVADNSNPPESRVPSKFLTAFLGALRQPKAKEGNKNTSFSFSDFHLVDSRSPVEEGSMLIVFEHKVENITKIRGPIRVVHRVHSSTITGTPTMVVMSLADRHVDPTTCPAYSNTHLLTNLRRKLAPVEARVRALTGGREGAAGEEPLYTIRRLLNTNGQSDPGHQVPDSPSPFNFSGGGHLVLLVDWTPGCSDAATTALAEACRDIHTAKTYSAKTAFSRPLPKAAAPRPVLPPLEPVSLDECLRTFTRREVLGAEDCWRCPKCKRDNVQATKELSFIHGYLPEILVIQLKRFTKYGIKVRNPVTYPLRGLDLTAFAAAAPESASKRPGAKDLYVYDLFAITKHVGFTGSSGHYTAHVLVGGKEWYLFDDSRVCKLENGPKTNDPDAYVLFYRRRRV